MSQFIEEKFNTERYGIDFKPIATDQSRIDVYLNMIGSGKEVLDVGCWDGYIGSLVKKNNNKVIGLDIVDASLAKAEKVLDGVLKRNLSEDWAEGIENKYDIALCGEVIEHVYDTDKFLDNFKKVLKPGGSLIISTPNIASFGRRLMLLLGISPNVETTSRSYDSGHVRYFTVNTLTKLLKEHGFIIDEVAGSVISFSPSGSLGTTKLARKIPTLATTIIVKCHL